MFTTFEARTADDAWLAVAQSLGSGEKKVQPSRNGPTREILHAAISIGEPRQRWVFSRKPSINPAFALAEVVWILAGRNDAYFLNFFNPRLPKFAGHARRYHGAYGHRLRQHFGVDQLKLIRGALKRCPDSRQIVLQIWDARKDLPTIHGAPRSPDIPCNIGSIVKVRDGRLDWLQILRSNDIYRGLPYNLVQFTMLQETMAASLDLELGEYHQISDSLHVYDADIHSLLDMRRSSRARNSETIRGTAREIEQAVRGIAERVDAAIAPDTSERQFLRSAGWIPKVPSFGNIYRVLCAEIARRRSWTSTSTAMAAQVDNPALRLLWAEWVARSANRGRTDTGWT